MFALDDETDPRAAEVDWLQEDAAIALYSLQRTRLESHRAHGNLMAADRQEDSAGGDQEETQVDHVLASWQDRDRWRLY